MSGFLAPRQRPMDGHVACARPCLLGTRTALTRRICAQGSCKQNACVDGAAGWMNEAEILSLDEVDAPSRGPCCLGWGCPCKRERCSLGARERLGSERRYHRVQCCSLRKGSRVSRSHGSL